ncbi:MAG: LamG-like jellyroll fold domain-containing protein [bacterium]
MLLKLKNKSSGFTLLEILLVIGIIAILAGIVIIAINPSKQLAQVRNSQRKSDIKQINNAITQYYIDNSSFPSTISTTTLTEVCNTGSVSNTATSTNRVNCATAGLANLSTLVPTYLVSIPTDPTGSSSLLSFVPTAYAATNATGTGYKVGVSATKQVLISAPLAELGVTVTVGNVPTTVASTLGVGLVAHYLMNDNLGTTNVLDNTSNHYDGTATQNTSAMTTTGRTQTALYFNDSTKINIGNIFYGDNYWNGTGFTVSVWHTMESWQNNRSYAILGGESSRPILFDILDNNASNNGYITIRALSDGGGPGFSTDYSSILRPGPGVWQHIVITVDASGNGKIYVDGINVTSATGQNKPQKINSTVLIGKQQPSNSYYKGNLDDLRIYNRALTQSEVTQLYNVGGGTEAE